MILVEFWPPTYLEVEMELCYLINNFIIIKLNKLGNHNMEGSTNLPT